PHLDADAQGRRRAHHHGPGPRRHQRHGRRRGVTPPASAAELADALRHGDRGALARLLTVVENGGDAAREAMAALRGTPSRGSVVGITGAPGAGKSTLTNRVVECARVDEQRVAVLAVDPTS